MSIFFKLTENTFRECIREPIFYLLLLLGICLIGIIPVFTLFVFFEQIKLVVDSAMATMLVLGLIAAALCATHTISREMRNGTVLLLLSKPVPRWSFIAAKIAGVIAALTIFIIPMMAGSFVSMFIAKDQFRLDFPLMSCYFGAVALCAAIAGAMNFIKGTSFISASVWLYTIAMPVLAVISFLVRGELDDKGFITPEQFTMASLLLFPAIWIMGSIAAALSTRFKIVTNLTLCTIIFFLGLISSYISTNWITGTSMENFFSAFMSIDAAGNTAAWCRTVLSGLCSCVLPNWQYFWLADALASHTVIPFGYVVKAAVYALIYAGMWSVLAVALFHDKEVAAEAVNN